MSFDGIPFSVEEERVMDCQHGQKYYKNHTPPHKRGYDYRVHVKLGVRHTSRNRHCKFAVSQVQKRRALKLCQKGWGKRSKEREKRPVRKFDNNIHDL